MKKEEPLWLQTLKWIGVLPAGVAASILVYWIWRLIHLLTASRYIEPDSWLNIIFMELMSSGLMGAAFVYVGVWLAPTKKEIVSYVLSGLNLVLSGMSLFATFLTIEYFSLIAIVALCVGAIATTVSISKGDIESLREPNDEDKYPTSQWS